MNFMAPHSAQSLGLQSMKTRITISVYIALVLVTSVTLSMNGAVVADAAKTYSSSCTTLSLLPIASLSAATTMCGAVSATPITPQSSAENAAGFARVGVSIALLGGLRKYDTATDLIVWTWFAPSVHQGEIFWVSPSDPAAGGGYAPTGAYASWWAGILNRALNQGTNMSYLLLGSTWSIPDVSLAPCVICEKQACSSACSPSGTASFTGTWWPSCTCTCKPGWVGVGCTRQIAVFPISSVSSANDLVTFCAGKGGYVAQPTSLAEEDAILRIVPVNASTDFAKPVAIGATASGSARTYCYRDGRLNGECVAKDGNTIAGQYSSYGDGVPATPTITPISVLRSFSYLTGRWSALAPASITQVACQFIMCSQYCETSNTNSFSGNYPSCVCACKDGFTGLRCQIEIIPTPTATLTFPHTVSKPHTHTLPSTHSDEISPSASHTITQSLSSTVHNHITPSPSATSSHASFTGTVGTTLSDHRSTSTITPTHSSDTSVTNAVTKRTATHTTHGTTSSSIRSTPSHTQHPTETYSNKKTQSDSLPHTQSSSRLSVTLSFSRNGDTGTPSVATATPTHTRAANTRSNTDTPHVSTLSTTLLPTPSSTWGTPKNLLSHTSTLSRSFLQVQKTASTTHTPSATVPVPPLATSTPTQDLSTLTPSLSVTHMQVTCPGVRFTVYKRESNTSNGMTVSSEDVKESDIHHGLIVFVMNITNNASSPTSFGFNHSSMGSLSVWGSFGVKIASPTCTIPTNKSMICILPPVANYTVSNFGSGLTIHGGGENHTTTDANNVSTTTLTPSVVSPACEGSLGGVPWLLGDLAVTSSTIVNDRGDDSYVNTARSSTLFAFGWFLLLDGSPIELQVMIVLLNSQCGTDADVETVRYVRYFISPFIDLSWVWVVVGNIAVTVLFTLVHYAIVLFVRACHTKSEAPEYHQVEQQRVSANLLFPSLPLLVCHFMYIGVACGTFELLNVTWGAQTGACIAGFAYLVAVPLMDGILMYRVLNVVFLPYNMSLLGCEPRNSVTSWIYPRGLWGPTMESKRFIGFITPHRGIYRYLILLIPFLGCVASLLFHALDGMLPCSYRYLIIAIILLFLAVVKSILLPRRTHIVSILTCILLVAVAGFAMLSFLMDVLDLSDSTDGVFVAKTVLIGTAVVSALLRTLVSIITFVAEYFWLRRRCERHTHDTAVTNAYVVDEHCQHILLNRANVRKGNVLESIGSSKGDDDGNDAFENANNEGHCADGGKEGGLFSPSSSAAPTRRPKQLSGSLLFSSVHDDDLFVSTRGYRYSNELVGEDGILSWATAPRRQSPRALSYSGRGKSSTVDQVGNHSVFGLIKSQRSRGGRSGALVIGADSFFADSFNSQAMLTLVGGAGGAGGVSKNREWSFKGASSGSGSFASGGGQQAVGVILPETTITAAASAGASAIKRKPQQYPSQYDVDDMDAYNYHRQPLRERAHPRSASTHNHDGGTRGGGGGGLARSVSYSYDAAQKEDDKETSQFCQSSRGGDVYSATREPPQRRHTAAHLTSNIKKGFSFWNTSSGTPTESPFNNPNNNNGRAYPVLDNNNIGSEVSVTTTSATAHAATAAPATSPKYKRENFWGDMEV